MDRGGNRTRQQYHDSWCIQRMAKPGRKRHHLFTKRETEENTSTSGKASQSDKPMIFMGDLNLDRNRFDDKEYHLKELAKALQNTAASCDLTTQQIGNTFMSNRRMKNGLETIQSAIDHIFYSKEKLRARCFSVASRTQ